MIRAFEILGGAIIRFVEDAGRYAMVTGSGGLWIFRPPYRIREIFRQLEFVGFQSISIVIITGLFTGGVFALQAAYGFGLFGAEVLTGSTRLKAGSATKAALVQRETQFGRRHRRRTGRPGERRGDGETAGERGGEGEGGRAAVRHGDAPEIVGATNRSGADLG